VWLTISDQLSVTSIVDKTLPSDFRSEEDRGPVAGHPASTVSPSTTRLTVTTLSGAFLGVEAIPKSLAQRLVDRGTWGFEELAKLARRCHKLAMP